MGSTVHLPVLGSLQVTLEQFDSGSTSSPRLEPGTVPGTDSLFTKFTENMKPHKILIKLILKFGIHEPSWM